MGERSACKASSVEHIHWLRVAVAALWKSPRLTTIIIIILYHHQHRYTVDLERRALSESGKVRKLAVICTERARLSSCVGKLEIISSQFYINFRAVDTDFRNGSASARFLSQLPYIILVSTTACLPAWLATGLTCVRWCDAAVLRLRSSKQASEKSVHSHRQTLCLINRNSSGVDCGWCSSRARVTTSTNATAESQCSQVGALVRASSRLRRRHKIGLRQTIRFGGEYDLVSFSIIKIITSCCGESVRRTTVWNGYQFESASNKINTTTTTITTTNHYYHQLVLAQHPFNMLLVLWGRTDWWGSDCPDNCVCVSDWRRSESLSVCLPDYILLYVCLYGCCVTIQERTRRHPIFSHSKNGSRSEG